MNHAHHPQNIDIWNLPISADGAFFASVLVWALWGIWIYMDMRNRGERCGPAMLLIVGPAAWLMILWRVTHRRPAARKDRIVWEHWGRN